MSDPQIPLTDLERSVIAAAKEAVAAWAIQRTLIDEDIFGGRYEDHRMWDLLELLRGVDPDFLRSLGPDDQAAADAFTASLSDE